MASGAGLKGFDEQSPFEVGPVFLPNRLSIKILGDPLSDTIKLLPKARFVLYDPRLRFLVCVSENGVFEELADRVDCVIVVVIDLLLLFELQTVVLCLIHQLSAPLNDHLVFSEDVKEEG